MKIEFRNILALNEQIIELVRSWRNSDDIRKFMVTDHIISKKEHQNWLRSLSCSNNTKFWVIYLNDLPVGSAYLKNIDYKHKTTDWGFYIADKSLRGKGIGSFVLFWLMRYVFDRMKFRKMYTAVLKNNITALVLYKKFGFIEEGITRKQLFREKKFKDLNIIGMLQKDWNAKKHEIKNIIQNKLSEPI